MRKWLAFHFLSLPIHYTITYYLLFSYVCIPSRHRIPSDYFRFLRYIWFVISSVIYTEWFKIRNLLHYIGVTNNTIYNNVCQGRSHETEFCTFWHFVNPRVYFCASKCLIVFRTSDSYTQELSENGRYNLIKRKRKEK